ncbi:hypothetical protein HK099_005893 [Clydaea vesicula]|uniref:Uncharacterized protein n=1 Tax=Clydaea vesicula TaxID=447962 RepID=A0AAD5XZD3_9FUNG|nr:hypothetical protein HK099_005893 [Clydaea vesicula]
MTSSLTTLKNISTTEALLTLEYLSDYEDKKMYMDFSIHNDILKSFDKAVSFHNLITRIFVERCKWTSTVFSHNYISREGESHQLNIKLSHDGFVYHRRKFIAANLQSHKMDSWFSLGDDILEEMPFLKQLKQNIGADSIAFLYNVKFNRMDIHFKKNDAKKSFLLITFESGYPSSDIDSYFF